MSFKYRFIVSFVLLEIFFIILIVSINFVAINNSSNKLIKDQISSSLTFLEEMLKVPLSIYDLATIDNVLHKSEQLTHFNSIVVLDSNSKILSQKYNFKYLALNDLIKNENDFKFEIEDKTYEIKYQKIVEDNVSLGSLYVVFDTSENKQFISKNKRNTLSIIFIEILISTFLSFLIGSRLTRMLTNLSDVAKEIGETKSPDIPYKQNKDEIGILANSLDKMQYDLKSRREKLKALTQNLEEQKEELILANKSKDEFLANMSHELKTPLNSINIISSVMQKNKNKNFTEKDIYNLSVINKCGHDLLYLINDVLDISKLEAKEIVLNNEDIDFKKLMEYIYEVFESQLQNKGLNFNFSCDDSIGLIHGDRIKIKQIIENLLSNALKFTKKGSITFESRDKGDFIEIIVEDEGIGIKEEKLENIFDRFKQADASTTRKYGGTGLGLAICKELCLLMGADIKVESTYEKGTLFKVSIPKNKKTINAKILLLNSNPIDLISVVTQLSKTNDVEQVFTIDELKVKLLENNYSLVIIDFDEKDLDEVIKIEHENVFLIKNKKLQLEQSINNKWFVTNKPFDKNELCELIRKKL